MNIEERIERLATDQYRLRHYISSSLTAQQMVTTAIIEFLAKDKLLDIPELLKHLAQLQEISSLSLDHEGIDGEGLRTAFRNIQYQLEQVQKRLLAKEEPNGQP